MIRKIVSAVLAFFVVCSVWVLPHTEAASAIKIYINGVQLKTDQAPITSGNHVLVPFRSIFEALDATVLWNQQTQTVTGLKDGNTIKLKLGAKTASINGIVTPLDTPARSLNGRTLVPVRFVSEALGQTVNWVPSLRRVVITTSEDSTPIDSGEVASASYVSAGVTGHNGNSSDVQINFKRPDSTLHVSEYRIMIVKEESSGSFTESKAATITSNFYTAVSVSQGEQSVYLPSGARDTDGNLITAGRSYRAFVLTVGNNGTFALSSASSSFRLDGDALLTASGVKLSDVGNYGDGRDLSVSFTKAQTDSAISGYRIFIVKTKDASVFKLTTANALSSTTYTSVGKTGSTISTVLNSSSRDTAGDSIRNNVAYTAFVLSVGSNGAANTLSAGSASFTLSGASAPVITKVNDVSNYGDGRDLQITFSRSADESKLSFYRVFAVRSENAAGFNLNTANSVASGRYYDVSKSGYGNISVNLPYQLKDTQGYTLGNGISYRLFVLAVSPDSSSQSILSAPSSEISLTSGAVKTVSNISVHDISDYGDGRDLLVNFTRASDESGISQYRIFVVKNSQAGSFNLDKANSLSSSFYSTVPANGNNSSLVPGQYAYAADGSRIASGVAYRIFVMSVSSGGYAGSSALSGTSSAITLSNASVPAVTNVTVSDIADNGDGRDLQVSFTRPASESNIDHYRVYVVKSDDAGSFNASKAADLSGSLYTYMPKTGGNQKFTLLTESRSTDGARIQEGQSYRIFVLSVGTYDTNSLSSASASIKLSDNLKVEAVTNLEVGDIADNGNASDLQVSFKKAANESNISKYRIMIIKDRDADDFSLSKANAVSSSYYQEINKTGADLSLRLDPSLHVAGTSGELVKEGTAYRVFVLSVGSKGTSAANALSEASPKITLTSNVTLKPAEQVKVALKEEDRGAITATVTFSDSDTEKLIAEYRVILVEDDTPFSLDKALKIERTGYMSNEVNENNQVKLDKDYAGESLQKGKKYQAYVLAVSKGDIPSVLSKPSESIQLSSHDLP